MEKKNITDFSDIRTLEKYSSAFTLSDMEIFIFPELFYPLVLANIMSPILWEWKNDPGSLISIRKASIIKQTGLNNS